MVQPDELRWQIRQQEYDIAGVWPRNSADYHRWIEEVSADWEEDCLSLPASPIRILN